MRPGAVLCRPGHQSASSAVLALRIGLLASFATLVQACSGQSHATVTAYDNAGPNGCAKCCGQWAPLHRTADGHVPAVGVTCAANQYPFGTVLMIEGVGLRTVQDRNPRRLKRVVCIFVATHSEAVVFGKKRLRVTVVKPKK